MFTIETALKQVSVTEKQVKKIRSQLPKLNREKVDHELKILLLDLKLLTKVVRGPRERDYGDKTTNHENIAKLWSAFLDYEISAHNVAICMMLVKVARLKHRPTEDCYIDMAGYAAIAGEINDRKKDDTDTTLPTTK